MYAAWRVAAQPRPAFGAGLWPVVVVLVTEYMLGAIVAAATRPDTSPG